MSESTKAQVQSAPVVKADLQDPLPESNWFWRRVFIFAVTAYFCWLLRDYTWRLSSVAMLRPEVGVPALTRIIVTMIWTIIIMATYYLVAPSAEQIVKMIQVARSLRAGVSLGSTATTISPEGTATSTATAGPPAAAPAQPAPPLPPAPQRDRPTETLE